MAPIKGDWDYIIDKAFQGALKPKISWEFKGELD